jgi:hypothetical protein
MTIMTQEEREIHELIVDQEIQRIKGLFKHQMFIIEDKSFGDPEDGDFSCRTNTREADIEKVIHGIDCKFRNKEDADYLVEYLKEISDFESLKEKFDEANDMGCDGTSKLENMFDYLLYKQEQERKALEYSTSKLLRKYGETEVNLTFIRLLNDDIEDINSKMENHDSGEQRAERYARGRHTFDEDNDYMKSHWNKHINEIERVKNWIKSNCPLLWAQYNNQQLNQEQHQEEQE